MVLREERGGGLLAIAQPAHAALAGRLAQAWDDELAPGLLVAAAHHDDVWAARDAAPPLDAATGRPESFLALSDAARVAVWSRASAVAEPLGPAPELWILRHAERLHARYDAAAVKAMTAAFGVRISALLGELGASSAAFSPGGLARGTAVLALLDTLSLRLCFGVTEPGEAGVLRLAPAAGVPAGTPTPVTVTPWPFRARRVEVHVEARRLPDRLPDQAALDAAWRAAAPFAERVTLLPA